MPKFLLLFLVAFFSTPHLHCILGSPPTRPVSACADFNHGAALGALSGLEKVYICPNDGIAGTACLETFPLRNRTEVIESSIGFTDVIIYMLVGPSRNSDVFLWWLPLLGNHATDIVLIADPCPNNQTTCDDGPNQLLSDIQIRHSFQHFHLFRVFPQDMGYKYLSCKLRTGAKKIFEQFPDKKIFLKIDTDTILLPNRFLHFIQTFDSIANIETRALYFGTVVESGMGLLLCGWDRAANRGIAAMGGLCYAQGGAGYGLTRLAMKALGDSPTCDPLNPSDDPEDLYTATVFYQTFNASVIHCGGFSSSELVNDRKMRGSISFHFIDAKWLKVYGEQLLHHYNVSHGAYN